MQLEITPLEEGIQLVKLSGRLDMKGTNEIDNQFTFSVGPAPASAIVDMTEVDFLASIGMRMLISAARAKNNRKLKLVLMNPTELVKDALVKAGFDELIPIVGDMNEALAVIQQAN